MRVLVIAQLTFREALRKKMIWGVLLLSIGFVVVYYWGFTLVRDDFLILLANSAVHPGGVGAGCWRRAANSTDARREAPKTYHMEFASSIPS